MASTTLSVGNAIGLAVLIAIANRHTAGLEKIAHTAATEEGIKLAFWFAAAGIVVSLLFAMLLPGRPRIGESKATLKL